MDPFVRFVDETEESNAEFRKRKDIKDKYYTMFQQLLMLESEYSQYDPESIEAKNISDQYELMSKEFGALGDQLHDGSYDRFVRGIPYYYESNANDLTFHDATRAFDAINRRGFDMNMDIQERKTQEEMQLKRFEAMVERGGPMVSMFGPVGSINRLIYKKATTFGHPVQSVQLNASDRMNLQEDMNNVELLKEDGLISYLLYRDLKGDIMLF